MAENRVTFEVWTWPHNGDAFTKKFPITAYITDYEFSAEFGIGRGDGVLHLDPTFARMTEILNRDYATPANDNASIIMVLKDGVPYRPYVAARLPKTISSGAKSVPLTIRSMTFFLDHASVGPFDHNSLIPDVDNPNPTRDPDWEYGAESVLRFGDSTTNEIQQIWRSTGMSSGTFTLKQSNNITESAAIAWNVSAGGLQTAVESLPDVTDVVVRGDGSDVAPWEIEFVDPAGDVGFTIEIGTNSTNGVFSTDTLTEGGTLDPSPWTKSYNPVTKTDHGNYQAFDIVDNTIAPVGAFPAGDTYVLRIDVDSLGGTGTDYGGAQQIVSVEGGSRWRGACYVYAPTTGRRFRIVVRDMEENLLNAKDFDVPADTLFLLDMPAVNIPTGVSEVIFRIGILEPTNIQAVYVAIQSAVFAPGFPPKPWGTIVNELLIKINQRTSLDSWVTVTWSNTLDSSGAAWDRDLSWEINLRQSLQQLCEISHEWGYESTGIYWSVANSRFEWGCYNAGSGGLDLTGTGFKIGMGDALMFGERVSRVPEITSAWAFGTNLKWGRAEDATMVSKWGVLESMALDRQGQDTMDALASQMVQDSELESAVQKIRIHFARITPGIDFNIGDFLDIDMGPVGIAGIFRVAGIVEGKTEDGEEYADVHLGALVKSPEVAQADAVRTMWRKLEVMEGGRVKNRVVEPAQTVVPPMGSHPRPVVIIPYDADPEWVSTFGDTFLGNGVDDRAVVQAAMDAAAELGGSGVVWFAPGYLALPMDLTQLDGLGMPYAVEVWAGLRLVGLSADTSLGGSGTFIEGFDNTGTHSSPFVGAPNSNWPAGAIFRMWGGNKVEHLHVYGAFIFDAFVLKQGGARISLSNIRVERCRYVLSAYAGARIWMERIDANNNSGFFLGGMSGSVQEVYIDDCYFAGSSEGIPAITNGLGLSNGVAGGAIQRVRIQRMDGNHSGSDFIRFHTLTGPCWIEDNYHFGIPWFTSGGSYVHITNFAGPLTIRGNLFDTCDEYGIALIDTGGQPNADIWIENNTIEEAGQHGIYLENIRGANIIGNRLWASGNTNGGFDGIHLTANCDENIIMRNIIGSIGWERYGINVASADCDENRILFNDVSRTFATAKMNNAGTGTILSVPADVTYGDNFT